MEFGKSAGFGLAGGGRTIPFWIHEDKEKMMPAIHFAFQAANREIVNDFYRAAIQANGKDNGKPGIRAMYHPNYYGAFILDSDGYNVEAVCHEPVTSE